MTEQQLNIGLEAMKMYYTLDEKRKSRKYQISRFYALANISASEPIYETMPWKFVEYIYLSRFLLGLDIEGVCLSPNALKGIRMFTFGVQISKEDIWDEVGKCYREDYFTKKGKYPNDKYIISRVEKLRQFLGGNLELVPPKQLVEG